MQRFFSRIQSAKQSVFGTPEWALARIEEAQDKKLEALDLSAPEGFEKLAKFPEEIYSLVKLTSLNLSGNNIGSLPLEISELQNLKDLDVSSNQLSSFPTLSFLRLTALNLSHNPIETFSYAAILSLRDLTSLDLSYTRDSYTQLIELPEAITRLPKLESLHFRGNHLRSLPYAIANLHNLTTLDLKDNLLSDLPKAFQLEKLHTLNLGNNQLRALPEAFAQLTNLQLLDLFDNPLGAFPEVVLRLPNLTALGLSQTNLDALPESLTQLEKLTSLNVSFNSLNEIPAWIAKLENLEILFWAGNGLRTLPRMLTRLQNLATLDLSFNQFAKLSETITHLERLTYLDLTRNILSELPVEIGRLQNLTTLKLNSNRLKSLPASIAELPDLTNLALQENPLITPPIEIAVQGVKAIRQYFRQLDEKGVDYLYEAKLLILGEGGAGKTTFANKLLNSNYTLKDEVSTQGVDVLKWSFPIEGDRQFRVNIWDFGGQEIYHATHQFFLTRRSLYVLVADTRKEDTDFYYWLNVAELLSDNSPLLIFKNEKQDRQRQISERQLRGQFDNLKDILAMNLANNRGLEKAKQEIRHHIQGLPHIGSPLPRTWVRVREQLEKDPRSYMSLDEYLAICREKGFSETKDSLQLSGYLHDIGVFLHFQDEPMLRKTIILKPKWGTDAVYKVLDNKTVIANLGRFTRADLQTIWDGPEYESMRDELLQLMMKFKLCYEIPTQKGTYIAPQLLSGDQPDYEWNTEENLLLRYTYEFMPKGILTQFIVVMHPYIWRDGGQDKVWKSGLVIEKDGTRAEVIEHYGRREIHVRVTGPQARDLMTVIRHELEQIHAAYKRLKYDELVRCKCSTCKENPEPHFYPISLLMHYRANNQLEIQCPKRFEMVNVMGLLGDVIDLSKLAEKIASGDTYYVQGDIVKGDKLMSEKKISISHSTVHGSVVAAESIKDSFNTIQNSSANDELKENLTKLTQAVEEMIKALPKEKAEETAEDMKVLVEQATKEKPNPKWYNVSIEGLIAAAQNLGKVGDEVITLADKVKTILTGGLL